LAGAYWGVAGIPTEWLDGLALREEIERAVGDLQALLPLMDNATWSG
jgi:hypothetical protein